MDTIKVKTKKENGLRKKIMRFQIRMRNNMKVKIKSIIKTKMKANLLKSNITKKMEIDKTLIIEKTEEEDKKGVDIGNKTTMIGNNIKNLMNKIIKGKEGEISKFIKKKETEAMSRK